jgi:predicted nucleotidyltransferase
VDDRNAGAYARPPTLADIVKICRALNGAGARYLLIGGFAVIIHGGVRTTRDIDLLVDDSPENLVLLKKALSVLEDNAVAAVEEEDLRKYAVVRVADEVVVDLLARACGVDYSEAAKAAETIEIEGTAIPVADKRTLIRTKTTFRPSDQADCLLLQALLDEESET